MADDEDPQTTKECYFCGSPGASKRCSRCRVALYCDASCQAKHWTLETSEHKKQCKPATVDSNSVKKAEYHAYVDSLPVVEGPNDLLVYHWIGSRDPAVVSLANRIRYPMPGPANQFFRTHEFLQNLVAHGEDTEENMTRLFGYEITPRENRAYLESFGPSQVDARRFLPRTPKPWFQVVGKLWFQARVAVACGEGAPDGATNAQVMGARYPPPLPEGVPATNQVLQQLLKLNLPLTTALREKHIVAADDGAVNALTCSICQERISSNVQLLPTCEHFFHSLCVTDWLQRDASCPVCRKVIPEAIPRPPTMQERNMAARLKDFRTSSEATSRKRPLSQSQLGSWPGTFGSSVHVIYQLSDELDFSGGACHVAVSPSGKQLAVTSTSIGKIVFLSLDVSSPNAKLIGTFTAGSGFPNGPECVAYDPSDGSETTLLVGVDSDIVKYRQRRPDQPCPLETVWTVRNEKPGTLSFDAEGRALSADSTEPKHWVSSDGVTKTKVPYKTNDCDYSSFHGRCVGGDLPINCVLALPNGDIIFPQCLALNSMNDDKVCVGLLRKGESVLHQIEVAGLTRSDVGHDDIGWKFCVGPRGDVFLAMPYPKPRLVHITDPSGDEECRGRCTALKGFRAIEEFGGICADGGNCLYILVVCNWPTEREIYRVNPEP